VLNQSTARVMAAMMERATRKLALAETAAESRRIFLRTIFHEVGRPLGARGV